MVMVSVSTTQIHGMKAGWITDLVTLEVLTPRLSFVLASQYLCSSLDQIESSSYPNEDLMKCCVASGL